MISLIVCSRKSDIPQALKDNVAQTIGNTPFEWIVIDNSKNRYSIFQAYNEGVRRSKGEILCFMHDDILFITEGWGGKVEKHLCEGVGLIGVIGNHMLPDCPSSWWTTSLETGHVIQRSFHDNRNQDVLCEKYRDVDSNCSDSVVVDGLWFCMPKQLFETIKFDDKLYSGFHCYDIDICMQVLGIGWSVRTVFDILIAHYSLGPLNKAFFQQRELWYDKWKSKLPIWRGVDLTSREVEFINDMSKNNNTLLVEKSIAQEEARLLRASKAYRLGKTILKPFSWLRNLFGI